MTKNKARISLQDAAALLGYANPEPIRVALRNRTFPLGMAYKARHKWVYVIPREAFMRFVETGQVETAAGGVILNR